ncbi:hypothetical protein K1Y78_15900 [Streptomyces sp. tea 10]|nr:hypothetical protein [Streptomyces sp. tea 10]
MNPNWQKSSYCSEGNSPAAFGTLIAALKKKPAPVSEGAHDDAPFHLRCADTVVTTTRRKWNAFVLGVRAGEFDHFAATR